MGLTTNFPDEARGERNVGNIYERLEDARRKRERALDTPAPANDDRRARHAMSAPVTRSFPTLKPPATDIQDTATERSLDWTVPWFLGFLIFAVIFGFAVG